MNIGEIVVTRGVETHTRGLRLQAQNSVDVLFLFRRAQSSPFDSLHRVGASIISLARNRGSGAEAS